MKRKLALLTAAFAFAGCTTLPLVGCENEDEPFEEAGENVQDAADDMGDELEDMGDEIDE